MNVCKLVTSPGSLSGIKTVKSLWHIPRKTKNSKMIKKNSKKKGEETEKQRKSQMHRSESNKEKYSENFEF